MIQLQLFMGSMFISHDLHRCFCSLSTLVRWGRNIRRGWIWGEIFLSAEFQLCKTFFIQRFGLRGGEYSVYFIMVILSLTKSSEYLSLPSLHKPDVESIWNVFTSTKQAPSILWLRSSGVFYFHSDLISASTNFTIF